LFELAEKLGRTVEELLVGSPGHRPISASEIVEWQALWKLRQWENEKQKKQHNSKRR
jgi:hypothetical protein